MVRESNSVLLALNGVRASRHAAHFLTNSIPCFCFAWILTAPVPMVLPTSAPQQHLMSDRVQGASLQEQQQEKRPAAWLQERFREPVKRWLLAALFWISVRQLHAHPALLTMVSACRRQSTIVHTQHAGVLLVARGVSALSIATPERLSVPHVAWIPLDSSALVTVSSAPGTRAVPPSTPAIQVPGQAAHLWMFMEMVPSTSPTARVHSLTRAVDSKEAVSSFPFVDNPTRSSTTPPAT